MILFIKNFPIIVAGWGNQESLVKIPKSGGVNAIEDTDVWFFKLIVRVCSVQ